MYVEIIGSALVPASLWLRRAPAQYGLLALLILLTIYFGPSSLTFSYLVCFHAGVLLATNPPAPVKNPRVLVLAGVVLFIVDKLAIGHNAWSILSNTIGAALVVIGVTQNAAERFLKLASVRHTGRVSYSLYLLHLPVIYLVAGTVGTLIQPGLLSTAVSLAVIFPLSLLLASVGYVIIEEPFIRAGREMTLASTPAVNGK
jgi:peptidoglycan/LPS O-acetylase OafA/YrhL